MWQTFDSYCLWSLLLVPRIIFGCYQTEWIFHIFSEIIKPVQEVPYLWFFTCGKASRLWDSKFILLVTVEIIQEFKNKIELLKACYCPLSNNFLIHKLMQNTQIAFFFLFRFMWWWIHRSNWTHIFTILPKPLPGKCKLHLHHLTAHWHWNWAEFHQHEYI